MRTGKTAIWVQSAQERIPTRIAALNARVAGSIVQTSWLISRAEDGFGRLRQFLLSSADGAAVG